RPAVMARRYLSLATAAGHGIVLLHDRVGHVGSSYALEVARALIPELKAKGFVFAAPVLRFSPPAPRPAPPGDRRWGETPHAPRLGDPGSAPPVPEEARRALAGSSVDPATIRLGDVNGDGHADVCGRAREGLVCALSDGHAFLGASLWLPEMSDAAG